MRLLEEKLDPLAMYKSSKALKSIIERDKLIVPNVANNNEYKTYFDVS